MARGDGERTYSFWTKSGRPLVLDGNEVTVPSGSSVGRLVGDRVFADGDVYVGTIVRNRLVFRSFDADGTIRPYARTVSPVAQDAVDPETMWGDEPIIPD